MMQMMHVMHVMHLALIISDLHAEMMQADANDAKSEILPVFLHH